jgi:hypothetical protein
MKSKLLDFAKTAGFSLIELLVFFPILVLIHTFLLSTELWSIVVQAVVLYVLGFAGGITGKLQRGIYQVLYALGISSGVSILFQGWNWHFWFGFLLGSFLVLRGIRFTRTSWYQLFPDSAYMVGLLIYFLAVPFMNFSELLLPYRTLINVFGFLSLSLFFYMMNRQQLIGATLSDPAKAASSLSKSVRGMNRLWVSAILVLIALIAFWGQLKDSLWWLIRSVIALLLRLSPDGKPQESSPASTAAPSGFPPLEEQGNPSLLALLFNKVVILLAYALIAVVVIGLFYLIITRFLPMITRAVRRLLGKIGSGVIVTEADGYVDEEESLLVWKDQPSLWRKGLLKRFSRTRDGELKWTQLLSNKDRIRFIYRNLIGKAIRDGYKYNRAATPLETEREVMRQQGYTESAQPNSVMAQVYNQARYGDKDPSDDEIRKVLEAVEPILGKRFK